MYLVAIAWMYVVVLMTAAEATAPNGTMLGALMTFLLYGLLPVSILVYLMRTPARKRARLKAEQAANEQGAALAETPINEAQSPQSPR
jgi:mannose/fructose/N-acetylgalactosamine-specific phosphotransferase system component IID